MDVVVRRGSRILFGVEGKTLVDNNNDKTTMHLSSRRRRLNWMRKNRSTVFTIVFDARNTYFSGVNSAPCSGHDLYVREGVGSFRLAGLAKANGAADLSGLMGLG